MSNEEKKRPAWGIEADLSGITPQNEPTQFVPIAIRPFIKHLIDMNQQHTGTIALFTARVREFEDKEAEYKRQLALQDETIQDIRGRLGLDAAADDAEVENG